MADNFSIKIITPEGQVTEDITSGVKLPAYDGEIGVLPQHIKYVGILGTGLLEYQSHPGQEVRRVAISEGICTFSQDCLTILAERAVTPDTVDVISFSLEREQLLAVINAGALDDPEVIAARRELAFIDAKEELIKQ